MIKINLATRKQMGGGAPSGGKTSKLSGLNLSGLSDLPIRKFLPFVLAAVVFTFFIDGMKDSDLQKFDAGIVKMRKEQEKLHAELQKTQGFEAVKKALEVDEQMVRKKIETIQKLLSDREANYKILVSLASSIPSDVWFRNLKLDQSELAIKGGAMGFNQVTDFMKSLNESALFTEVQVPSTQQEKDEAGQIVGFEMSAKRR
ncbi:PilN domain-containing protein [Bdellovibrionota bacterium FG-2]